MLTSLHQSPRALIVLMLAAFLSFGALSGCTEDSPEYDGNNAANNNAANNNTANNSEDPDNNTANNTANNNDEEPDNNTANNSEDPNNNTANNSEDPNNNTANNSEDPFDDLTGAPCQSNGECGFGGFCVVESEGFNGGYCISQCNPSDPQPCPGDNPCTLLGENNLCVAGCSSDDDCREGYGCIDHIGEEPFCFPVECRVDADCADGQTCGRGACGNPDSETGDTCEANSDCEPGSFCVGEIDEMGEESGFVDGYCTLPNCTSDEECSGDNAYCAFNGQGTFCLVECDSVEDCRQGYSCSPFDGKKACLPGQCIADEDCPEGASCVDGLCGDPEASVGDTCTDGDPCAPGSFCLSDEDEDANTEGFVGGYCSNQCNAFASGQCEEGTVCIPFDQNGTGVCLVSCETNEGCREGGFYECRLAYPGLPEEATTCMPLVCSEDNACPEGYTCEENACVAAE